MSYIFDDWKKAVQKLNDSIEKSVGEIRECKDAIRRLQVDNVNEEHCGRYLRDNGRNVLRLHCQPAACGLHPGTRESPRRSSRCCR